MIDLIPIMLLIDLIHPIHVEDELVVHGGDAGDLRGELEDASAIVHRLHRLDRTDLFRGHRMGFMQSFRFFHSQKLQEESEQRVHGRRGRLPAVDVLLGPLHQELDDFL